VLDGRLTLGTTLVFIAYLAMLQRELQAFPNAYTAVQSAGASLDRVRELLAAQDGEVADRPGAPALPRSAGDVSIEEVTFGYAVDQPVLRGASLRARPGETVAIVGPTGAGKSTLVSLIPRFVDPQSGRVLIDGVDVRNVTVRSVRDQVAVVLQEPFLFPMSVAANIEIGRPGASRREIEEAARAARAAEFVERLPHGYDTVLGERGATLSGGERQRLAIARAILKDAPILILDEPTSALDAETEHALLAAFDRLMQGRTTFVIAHRLSTIRGATTIVVMDGGRVVEQGSHAELLALGGLYRHLYRLQSREPAENPAAS
jgi:ATP-binding cassette subfamily B protein/subfamily B ATP-binding cassette protein MsbA